jgi:hypothetical protein
MVKEWRESGYRSVDMETATLFAVAKHCGFAATALLVVWDQLTANRSFLDPPDSRGADPAGRRQHCCIREHAGYCPLATSNATFLPWNLGQISRAPRPQEPLGTR